MEKPFKVFFTISIIINRKCSMEMRDIRKKSTELFLKMVHSLI